MMFVNVVSNDPLHLTGLGLLGRIVWFPSCIKGSWPFWLLVSFVKEMLPWFSCDNSRPAFDFHRFENLLGGLRAGFNFVELLLGYGDHRDLFCCVD